MADRNPASVADRHPGPSAGAGRAGARKQRAAAAVDAEVQTEAPKTQMLAPRALYQDVAERLRQRIFARELEPGSWVDELKIAAELGISRTPLREALKVLAVEGLVTMKVRRGAYVTEMSRDDVAQVYHLLALLEADAAADVASHASAEQLAELATLHDKLAKQTRQRDAFFATNELFHLKLLAFAGNRWRAQIVADLRKVMKLNRHHSLFRQGRISESLAEHQALMDALQTRRAAQARKLMAEHFRSGLQAATA
jgi:DNA-binding GntR family transcriptional regulator